jgi:acetate kinase
MRVLVVNAGSSSLKLRVLSDLDVAASADLPGSADQAAIKTAIESFGPVDVVGHRIVHGGTLYRSAVLIDERVRQRLEALTDLAPLHQPKSLAALDAVSAVLPSVPAVACFDTAFHASIPDAASTYALPPEWRERWALRRYGFHGLSHAYVSRRAGELLGRSDLRIVTCHLGAGASLCAVLSGRSVDTTMGFTPLDGLVMATRSGTIDPGLVLWLSEHAGTPSAELAATLERRSGLLGLAGTSDMREVLSRAASGDARALLAREVYLHRLRALIASMAAAMDGLDVLVFTGGVGENSAEIRARAMDGLGFLGVRPGQDHAFAGGSGSREIGAADADVRTFVIPAREDIQIAREVQELLPDEPALPLRSGLFVPGPSFRALLLAGPRPRPAWAPPGLRARADSSECGILPNRVWSLPHSPESGARAAGSLDAQSTHYGPICRDQ